MMIEKNKRQIKKMLHTNKKSLRLTESIFYIFPNKYSKTCGGKACRMIVASKVGCRWWSPSDLMFVGKSETFNVR